MQAESHTTKSPTTQPAVTELVVPGRSSSARRFKMTQQNPQSQPAVTEHVIPVILLPPDEATSFKINPTQQNPQPQPVVPPPPDEATRFKKTQQNPQSQPAVTEHVIPVNLPPPDESTRFQINPTQRNPQSQPVVPRPHEDPPDEATYEHLAEDIQMQKQRISSRLKLVLRLCQFHVGFQAIGFAAVMSSTKITCSRACYIAVASALVGIPVFLVLLAVSVQINSLMDAYDNAWETFKRKQTLFLSANPDTRHMEVRYSIWMFCCLKRAPRWERHATVYATLLLFVLFTVMIVLGPYRFLC